MELEQHTTNSGLPIESPSVLDGTWEKTGRSANTAALVGLLGIGVLYVNAQSILFLFGYLVTKIFITEPEVTGTFAERMSAMARNLNPSMRISLLISQYLFMLFPVWWLVKQWHSRHVRDYVRLKSCSLKEIILAGLATLAIIPTGAYIGNEFMRWFRLPEVFNKFYQEMFTANSLLEFFWLIFLIAITPAICEEVFFRGYVQRTFERTIRAKSIWLVGIIFGLYHMQPLSLITLSLLGIIFGFFYYQSKSLLPSMAGHFTNNFLAILLYYKEIKIGGVNLATAEQIPISWVLTTLPIGIVMLLLYYQVTRSRKKIRMR